MVDELFEVFEDLFERRGKHKKKKGKPQLGQEVAGLPPARPSPPIHCIACGARNEATARFCLECGDILPSPGEEFRCVKCESPLPLKAKFCPRCGARAG